MKPITDMDYVVLYANKLKKDNRYFDQQKKLIESQMHSSSILFRNMFGRGNDFIKNAREYLKNIGLVP